MKVRKSKLVQIIKEELATVLTEAELAPAIYNALKASGNLPAGATIKKQAASPGASAGGSKSNFNQTTGAPQTKKGERLCAQNPKCYDKHLKDMVSKNKFSTITGQPTAPLKQIYQGTAKKAGAATAASGAGKSDAKGRAQNRLQKWFDQDFNPRGSRGKAAASSWLAYAKSVAKHEAAERAGKGSLVPTPSMIKFPELRDLCAKSPACKKKWLTAPSATKTPEPKGKPEDPAVAEFRAEKNRIKDEYKKTLRRMIRSGASKSETDKLTDDFNKKIYTLTQRRVAQKKG